MDGTQKVPVRWLPALRASLDAGTELPHLERALAAWLHYLSAQRSDSGAALAISDPGAAALGARLQAAHNADDVIRAALAHTGVFGEAPWPEGFIARLAKHLAVLRNHGVAALLSHASTVATIACQQSM
jgi:fructuronate reductase